MTSLKACFAALLILFTLGTARAESSNPDQNAAYNQHYPEISYEDLRKSIDHGQVFIIDANSEQSYSNGHIPLAHSINQRERLTVQLPPLKTFPIVVYCGGPQCTAWHRAADFAAARGYTNIMHYRGGIKGWKDQGDSLATGSGV